MERLTRWIDDTKDIAIESKEATKDECLKRLAEYEDAEEQERIFKMPFAYGDTIFEIAENNHRIFEWTVKGYNFTEDSTYICVKDYTLINAANIGKTVFRTLEEAETKLKEMESGNEQ